MLRLFLFKFVIGLIKVIPIMMVPVVSRVLSVFAYFIAKKDRRTLFRNVEKIYGIAPHSNFAKLFAKQVFHHQVCAAIESVKGMQKPSVLRLEGLDALEAQMKSLETYEGGKVYITAHLGSWELNGALAAKVATKRFYALAKPSKMAEITDYVGKLREGSGISVLWTGKTTLFRSMVKAMKEGDWLSFVMDQKPDNRMGTEVAFFDQPTTFVNGPATMAIKFSAPVLGVYCVRTGVFTYRIIVDLILQPNHGVKDQALVCEMMARSMEKVIRDYPEQWCWNYKRWNFDAVKD